MFVVALFVILVAFSVFYFYRAVLTCHNCDRAGLRATGLRKTYDMGSGVQEEFECIYCGSKEWKTVGAMEGGLRDTWGKLRDFWNRTKPRAEVIDAVRTGLRRTWGELRDFRNPTKPRGEVIDAVWSGLRNTYRELRESLNPTRPRAVEEAEEPKHLIQLPVEAQPVRPGTRPEDSKADRAEVSAKEITPEIPKTCRIGPSRLRDASDARRAAMFAEGGMSIWEKALGPTHPLVATALNNLADLYQDQGKHAEAEPLYKRTLAIRENAVGPAHPDVAQSLNNLAMLYHAQGKYAEAEPLYERALAVVEKALGVDHAHVATVLGNMAELNKQTGCVDEAKRLEERAKAVRSRNK